MSRRDANYVDAHVGSRIRLRRQMIGMSQEKLGEILGITFQQVQKYEKGSNRVSASRMHHMSRALGVNIQYFFDDLPDNDVSGFAETTPETSLMQALNSLEGVQLMKAFSDAGTPAKRKLIASVVRAIADSRE